MPTGDLFGGALPEDLLPPVARDLAERLGLPALQKLSDRYGGLRLKVPARVPKDPHHPLNLALGRDGAEVLVREYAGTPLDVPKLHARAVALVHREIVHRRQAGQSEATVARAVGLTARHVRRIWAKHRDAEPSPQGELF